MDGCSIKCGGACCAVFWLTRTAEEWRDPTTAETVRDGKTIADMVIPLTHAEARERRRRLVPGAEDWEPQGEEGHYFTCRHWDEETRLCGIYERRPQMCADFPYDRTCEYGCGGVASEVVAVRWRVIREPKLLSRGQ